MLLERPIPFAYVVRQCGRDVLTVVGIASLVELLVWFEQDVVPDIELAIPSFLGTAISLLLSFKLAQSYDRWWEARKVWGAVVNDSRTLARQVLSFAGEGAAVTRMVRRQVAWCYCLGQSLRGQDWRTGTEGHLSEADIAEANQHDNKALALLLQHSRDLSELAAQAPLSDYQRVALDDTLSRLTDSMGRAERIRNTVFPTAYRVFLHLFIYVFITTLSVALGDVKGAMQVLVTTVVAIPLFLLEGTATNLQDPFSNRPTDTPVTSIARTIEVNLLQLLGLPDGPQAELAPGAAEAFYTM